MKLKNILLALSAIVLMFSCTEFTDFNVDTKHPDSAESRALVSNAQKNLVDLMQSTNVNRNVFRLYAQQWAQTTYPQESQYVTDARNIPDFFWNEMYRDVIRDLFEARTLLLAEDALTPEAQALQANKLAVIDLCDVHAYQVLVDLFGDVPYTEAMDITNVLPAYDDAQAVYKDLLARASASVAAITPGAGGYGGNDLIYGGDMAKWAAFGNSLILKMAMRVSDADDATAKQYAEAAAAGAFTSNADNADFVYLGADPNANPLHVDLVLSGRSDFVGANTMIDIMNDLDDPRRAVYYELAPDTTVYIGGTYGSANGFNSNSHIGDLLHGATFPGMIMNYAEVCFLLAEANERGYAVGGSAEDWYNAGIMASFDEWGAGDAAAYLAQPNVAYSTAAGDWREKIGTQKWIALYNLGFEAWTEWRRLDAPTLNPPPGMTAADIPTRMHYPYNEATLNGASYNAAAAKYGNDSNTAKIFWDKN